MNECLECSRQPARAAGCSCAPAGAVVPACGTGPNWGRAQMCGARSSLLFAAAMLMLATVGAEGEDGAADTKDAAAPDAAEAKTDSEDDDSLGDYKYWRREASYRVVDEGDFDRLTDPRLLGADGSVVIDDVLVPKFQWYQDKRQLYLTFLLKNLENQTVSHDDDWFNFTTVADIQRVVQSHHFKQESQQQLSKKAVYAVQLPFKYKVLANRTKDQVSTGWKTFIFRKAAKGKEWKNLLKDPANTAYEKQMRKDWKKYGSESDDPEFLVEKAKNLDSVIAAGGITVIQFSPTWSHKEREWAKQYGGAADALEGDARLVKVNALTDNAVMERFGITMTQHDSNPRPQYVVLIDGERLEPGYSGETETGKLVEFVRRLTKPAVVDLATAEDVTELLKSQPRCAIAWGVPKGSQSYTAMMNAGRTLQAVGEPKVSLATVADVDATDGNSAAGFLRGIIPALEGVPGPIIVLVAAQAEASDSTAEESGAGSPVQIEATRFTDAPLTAESAAADIARTAAAWGYQAVALEDQQSTLAATMKNRMDNAARVGVATLVLHIKEKYSKEESALCPSCPAAVEAVTSILSHDASTPVTEPLLTVRGVVSSGGHISGSVPQALATSQGLDGTTFPGLAVLAGEVGAQKTYTYSMADRGEMTADSVKAFLEAVLSGQVSAAVRSESVPQEDSKGPGSGVVDKVVGLTVEDFVSITREKTDVVLVICREDDDVSSKYKEKATKLAEKLAHVPTIAFASLDLSHNGVPAALTSDDQIGEDPKGWEGIWLWPASGGDGGEVAKPVRAKRKAPLKDLAKWIKTKVTTPFDAKAQGLPAGTYSQSCKGCRVEGAELGHAKKMLVCASCSGSSAANAGKVSVAVESCEAGFANEGGSLVCDKAAEMAAEVEAAVGAEAAAGAPGGEAEQATGDKEL